MVVVHTADRKRAKLKEHEWCPVTATLSLIGKKYMLLIIHNLQQEKVMRFGELQKAIEGISTKTLAERLHELEEEGLVKRKVYPVVPLKVEYSLTPKGKSLDEIIGSMRNWGAKHA